MAETDIEWCYTVLPDGRVFKGYSGNPWIGCCKVSPGCKGCYAEHDTPARVLRAKGLEVWGQKAPRPEVKGFWRAVPRWDRRAAKLGVSLKHFVGSNCDVFEGRADLDPLRARLFTLLENTPHLTHILVTKRPENVREMVPRRWLEAWPAHIWMLTSVEDQKRAEERIPELLRIPAPVRGVSAEPLLEEVDLSRWLDALDWVIVGGESGPSARPLDLAWPRKIRDQCAAAGTAYFFKQAGARPVFSGITRPGEDMPRRLRDAHGHFDVLLNDKKGGDLDELPLDLRIRQWPEVRR